jgi:hypothetical protein
MDIKVFSKYTRNICLSGWSSLTFLTLSTFQCLGFCCVFLSRFPSCRSWIAFQGCLEQGRKPCIQGKSWCVLEAPLFMRAVCLKVFSEDYFADICRFCWSYLYIWSLNVFVSRLERRTKAQEALEYNPFHLAFLHDFALKFNALRIAKRL